MSDPKDWEPNRKCTGACFCTGECREYRAPETKFSDSGDEREISQEAGSLGDLIHWGVRFGGIL